MPEIDELFRCALETRVGATAMSPRASFGDFIADFRFAVATALPHFGGSGQTLRNRAGSP